MNESEIARILEGVRSAIRELVVPELRAIRSAIEKVNHNSAPKIGPDFTRFEKYFNIAIANIVYEAKISELEKQLKRLKSKARRSSKSENLKEA
jgi:hypothetical protein